MPDALRLQLQAEFGSLPSVAAELLEALGLLESFCGTLLRLKVALELDAAEGDPVVARGVGAGEEHAEAAEGSAFDG